MQETHQALGSTGDQPAPAYLECPVVVDGVVISSIADHSRFETAGLSDIFPLLSSPDPSSANSSRFSIDGSHLENISDNLRLSPKTRSHHRRTASSSSIPQRSKFANFGRSAPFRAHDANRETQQPAVLAGDRPTPLQLPKLAIPKNDRFQPSGILPVPPPPFHIPHSSLWSSQNCTEMFFFGQRHGQPRNANGTLPGTVGLTTGSPMARSGDAIVSPESIPAAGGDASRRSRLFTRSLMGSIFSRKPSSTFDGQRETTLSPVSPLSGTSAVGQSTSWLASSTATKGNELRMCEVCETDLPATDFPQPTSQCQHRLQTCRTCVEAWIAVNLNTQSPDRIVCPEPYCGKPLEHADIARFSPADTFALSAAPPPRLRTPH
jgi:hypothetical protein